MFWTYILISGLVSVFFAFHYKEKVTNNNPQIESVFWMVYVTMFSAGFFLAPILTYLHFSNMYLAYKLKTKLIRLKQSLENRVNNLKVKRALLNDNDLEGREKLTEEIENTLVDIMQVELQLKSI